MSDVVPFLLLFILFYILFYCLSPPISSVIILWLRILLLYFYGLFSIGLVSGSWLGSQVDFGFCFGSLLIFIFCISSFNVWCIENWSLCFFFFSMGLSLSYAYNRKVNELTRVNSNFFLLFFLKNIFFVSPFDIGLVDNWVSLVYSICF
jgi:hypothetical protein